MSTNMDLGEPYEKIIAGAIKEGHAKTKTEVVRQALKVYERQLRVDKEENLVVGMAVNKMVDEMVSGKRKSYSHAEVKRMFKDKLEK